MPPTPIDKVKALYFTAGIGCAILAFFLALLIISIAFARFDERGSGRDKLQNFLAAQTKTNPEIPPEKGKGRRN